MSRLGIRALPGRACGWHWHRQLPLDTRHHERHERHEYDSDDDQADGEHGLLPSGDPGVAAGAGD